MTEHVHNRISDQYFGSGDRRLLPALRTMTAPLWLGPAARTSFTVAPGRLVTFGTDVLFRDGGGQHHPCLCAAVEPGDELWALGYPRGDENDPTVVGLRCPAVLGHDHAVPQQLELVFGEPGIGSTGAPVLNWRTGSVCGLLLVTADTGLWLVPIQPVAPPDPAWLALMDDDQLRASGQRYPRTTLRAYLTDLHGLGEGHLYLPQHLHHESDGTHRVTVESLADRLDGTQVLGDPGVGKSSLVRHLAAASATRWLAGETCPFVPIPVPARALAVTGSLPRLLAEGVTHEVTTALDISALVALFEREPMPGVPWLVLVDGLDEVMNEFDRRLVLDRVLGDRELYRFLVTSRPLGRDAYDRPSYVVEPFDDGELARFARAWFTDAGYQGVDGMVRTFMTEVALTGLGRHARVPLVSMMLCVVFTSDTGDGLPRGQYAVYEQFFAVLARKLATSGLREEFRRHGSAYGPAAEEALARLLIDLPALLEEIACAQQGLGMPLDTRPILAQAVDRSRTIKPPAIPTATWAELVGEALRASGLLVLHRESEFRFLHHTIQEYLAARRLARDAERAAVLAPQKVWPWPQLEVKIFVVALWTANGIDLSGPFARLTRGWHRDTNLGFLVEVARRGIPLPPTIHARVASILAARLHSDRGMSEWKEAVRWLRDLDPSRVVDELSELVRRSPASHRAMDAMTELTTVDPARVTELAPTVAYNEANGPAQRLRLAKHVLYADRRTGAEVLRKLATSPGMGELAVEAAYLLVNEDQASATELLGQLATGQSSVAAGRALLRCGERGIAELDRVWEAMPIDAGTRLALTNQIAEVNRNAADWRYQDLVDTQEVPADVRLAAAQELARLNVESGVRALRQLATDRRMPSPMRVEAAAYLAEKLSQGTGDLAAIAVDARIPVDDRIKAAQLLSHTDPRQAASVLAEISVAHEGQHDIGALAAKFDKEESTRAMIRFVGNPTAPEDKRVAVATRLAAMGRTAEILQELEGIAEDQHVTGRERIQAADLISELDERLALTLYLRISTNCTDGLLRIEAALRAGDIDEREGMAALADLALSESMEEHLYAIAVAAIFVNATMAREQWRYLPKGAREAMQQAVHDLK